MKIAVLLGGASAEREVSLDSGSAIARALQERGHLVLGIDPASGRRLKGVEVAGAIGNEADPVPPTPGLPIHQPGGPLARAFDELPGARDIDVVFVGLHGGAGEDGRVQALLDLIGVPYTGSGPLGSALAMDKLVTKELFVAGDVPTPPWLVGRPDAAHVERALGYPVVVKPSHEGSTVGVSVVRSAEELVPALDRASEFDGPPLIERFISGRELAVGILGQDALPVVEIRPTHEIYDYECKYTKGMSDYEVPAPLNPATTEKVQELALKAHRILRLSAYSRVDFRLDEKDAPWCLEANSLPGMTATSLLPKAAAAAGLSFEDLCDRIAHLAVAPRDDGNTAQR